MILVDTHVLIWIVAAPDRLSRRAASAVRRARNTDGLAVAAITLWELAFLLTRGLLRWYGTVEDGVRAITAGAGVVIRPITEEIAALAAQFPDDYPHDPADRLIGATARAEGLALVTRDERIRKSPLLHTIW